MKNRTNKILLTVFLLSIAPAAGCALGWAVYGFHQLYKRGDIRG